MATILLDIDGVLNPLGSLVSHPMEATFMPYQRNWINWRLSIAYHEPMIEELLHQGNEIIWASSWGEDSNHVCRFLGLEEFNYLLLTKKNATLHSWKFEAISAYIENNPEDKIVWIDDEITEADITWAKNYPLALFYKVDPEMGYLQSDHDEVLSFCESI